MEANKMQVATTILNQLGGARFLMMTGAKELVGGESSLQMRLPENQSGARTFLVRYNPGQDLYELQFGKIKNLEWQVVKEYKGVYAEQLTEIFEQVTGLYTRL